MAMQLRMPGCLARKAAIGLVVQAAAAVLVLPTPPEAAFMDTQCSRTSDSSAFVEAHLSPHGSGLSALSGLGVQNGVEAVEDAKLKQTEGYAGGDSKLDEQLFRKSAEAFDRVSATIQWH